MRKHLLGLVYLSLCVVGLAHADSWNLPHELSDINTDVKFEVDSTWHMVRGMTKNIHGRAWLKNPSDFTSIVAEISIPVPDFNTGNRSRDKRMREVMHANHYQDVQFRINKVDDVCDPSTLEMGQMCEVKIEGDLSISNTTHQLSIPAKIEHNQDGYTISGQTSLDWADYGVEDPSILIAKLKPTVIVSFKVNLDSQNVRQEMSDAEPS